MFLVYFVTTDDVHSLPLQSSRGYKFKNAHGSTPVVQPTGLTIGNTQPCVFRPLFRQTQSQLGQLPQFFQGATSHLRLCDVS